MDSSGLPWRVQPFTQAQREAGIRKRRAQSAYLKSSGKGLLLRKIRRKMLAEGGLWSPPKRVIRPKGYKPQKRQYYYEGQQNVMPALEPFYGGPEMMVITKSGRASKRKNYY